MDRLAREVYLLLQDNNYNEIEEKTRGIEYANHSGMLSCMIVYYIKCDNKKQIEECLHYNLKKRDYLHICNYLENNVEIFLGICKRFDWETKDIDYMIENKLNKLLICMNGIYTETSYNSNCDYTGEYNKDINVKEMYNYLLKNNIDMSNDLNKKYDIIIDGGNIIFSSSLYSPMELINKYVSLLKGYSVLLVIHKRHRKKLIDLSVDVCYTEYKMNDDLIILKYYCLFGDSLILTNDKFYDHLHGMSKQAHEVLHNRCIRYDNFNIEIPLVSRCIQVKGEEVYIPVKNSNLFYKI